MYRSFFPVPGATKSISATTSSGNVAFDVTTLPRGEIQVRVYNKGTDLVYVSFGNGSGLAASKTLDVPVPSGAVEVVTVLNTDRFPCTYAAAICDASTATVFFTPGTGI